MKQRLARFLRHGTMSRRALCCLAVSAGTTVLSAIVLVALAVGAGVPAGAANVAAVCCDIVPSYWANRRWTWGRSGRGSVAREMVPFWALSLSGLVASTVMVALVAHWTSTSPVSVRAVALPVANAATFAALWVVQFVILDRVIFRPSMVR